jgi:uncharacterized cupredoxin-like copper-binding protein
VIRIALVAVTAYAVLFASVASSAHSTVGRLGVGESEFHLVLSRASVKTGLVIVQLQNDGQDVHDLRMKRIGGTRTYAFPLTSPGGRATRTLKLLPGRYRLWCSVANHAQLGMQAVLRVRR